MDDVPARWQLNLLREKLGSSSLDPGGFLFSPMTASTGGHRIGIRVSHEGYKKALFSAQYSPSREYAGFNKNRGDYTVAMSPGEDGPRESHIYVRWEEVVRRFGEWLTYLAREFDARNDRRQFILLPSISPPATPSDEAFTEAEIEVIEPFLIAAEEEFIEVIEVELATREDLDDLKAYISSEFAAVREELRRQSKRGWLRVLTGMGAQVAAKVDPDVWAKMVEVIERLANSVDLPSLLSG